MKVYDILKFAHTFYFNDQCKTVSRQQLIFLKFKLKIKSKSVRKRVCKSEKVTESVRFEIRNMPMPNMFRLFFPK